MILQILALFTLFQLVLRKQFKKKLIAFYNKEIFFEFWYELLSYLLQVYICV